MKITKAQIKQVLKEELKKVRQLKEDTKASDEPYVDPFSPEQRKAMKAHTAVSYTHLTLPTIYPV